MAHPDDAEFNAAGLMLRWQQAGGAIHIICLTDGSAGHQHMSRDELAHRRANEAHKSAQLLNAELDIWPIRDGELSTDLSNRHELIKCIRRVAPDLIVTHRTADYHPDHRAAGQLVQDACYLLQVPNVAPDTPPLTRIPPVLMSEDQFSYPRPFRADWVIDTGQQLDSMMNLLSCHASQVYEWLPHTYGLSVPRQNRLSWLKQWYIERPKKTAQRHSQEFSYAEAYEISEYGGSFRPPSLESNESDNQTTE